MKAVDFLSRLEKKEFFQEFKKENKDFFLCAIFCILTKQETEGDKVTLDFYVPSKNKIAFSESPFNEICFSEQEKNEMTPLENLKDIQIDLEDLWEEVERVKKEKKIEHNTGKIIGVLTNTGWGLTCLSSTLELLKIKLNSKTKEILEAKKESLSDMVKIQKK